mgnify:CR=1 FL=1
MINLGSKIRFLRKNKGITQEQLACALNMSPQAVSKWENNMCIPDVALLPEIAELLKEFSGMTEQTDAHLEIAAAKAAANQTSFLIGYS